MEAALRLAHDLQVDLAPRPDIVPTPPFPTGGEGEQQQDDAKRALFTSHLLRMRAAQAQLLEVEVSLAAAKERTSSASVANLETLQASIERVAAVAASLERICERGGTAGLVAQLQQPFTGNLVVAPPAHHRQVMSLLNGAVSELTSLQSALQSVCSAGSLPPAASCSSPHLGLLLDVASYLTQCQQYGEALTLTRDKAPLHLLP